MALIGRITDLIHATANQQVEKLEDIQTVPLAKEHLEELGRQIQQLEALYGESSADLSQAQRRLDTLTSQKNSLNSQAQQAVLLTRQHPDQATQLETLAKQKLVQIQSLESQIPAAQQEVDHLTGGVNDLRSQIQDLHEKQIALGNKIHELEATEHLASAENKTASALEQAQMIVGQGMSDNFDDANARMQHRADAAKARLDLASGTLNSGNSAEKLMQQDAADDMLSQLKAQMGITPQATAPATTAA